VRISTPIIILIKS